MTGGGYLTTPDWNQTSLGGMLEGILSYLRGPQTVFEVQTDVENGFCTGRFNLSGTGAGGSTGWDTPMIQLGKFYGSFPFTVEFSALVKGEPVTQTVRIEEHEAVSVDSAAAQAWAGRAIQDMEVQAMTNQIISSIVDLSLRERVLSTHTAFLALEPNDTIAACASCTDESGATDVEEDAATDTTSAETLEAYPNPFNSTTNIRVKLPAGTTPEQSALRICNTLGQVVRTFDTSVLEPSASTVVRWDGDNDGGGRVSSGVYFVILTTPRGTRSVKVLLVR
jgi:hypothetical protein